MKKRGFALIYVIFFVMITSITIISVTSISLSDIRQTRKVLATDGAFQMAESGIEDGIANYKNDIPWSTTHSIIYYNVNNDAYTDAPIESDFTLDKGNYQFQVFDDVGTIRIEAVGYFKNSKVKMKADLDISGNWKIYQAGF